MMKPRPTLLSALLLALNVGAAAATGRSDGSADTTVPLVLAMPGSEFEGPARFDNSVARSARAD